MGFLKFLFIGIITCSSANSWAQISSSDIQLWFEDSFEGNALTTTANFLSEAEELIVLSFEFETKELKNGLEKTVEISQGEFLAAQNLPLPLANSTVALINREELIFQLRIYQEKELIVQKVYNWKNKEETKAKQPDSIVRQKSILNPQEQEIVSAEIDQKKETKIAPKPTRKDAKDALEISGLIIDETRSKVGRDFYEIFFRKWIPPANVPQDFIITIKELPSFGRGGRVNIVVDDQSMGNRNLSPRIDYVESQVNASIRQIRSYLSNRAKLSKDLENEDTSGSGIF